jgi:hypothetical protein
MHPKPRIVENHNFDFSRPENRNLVQWGLFLFSVIALTCISVLSVLLPFLMVYLL